MSQKRIITEPIVIVEDDHDDQFLIQKVFDRLGVDSELIFFSNGKEALNYLKSTHTETFIIICDINMPVMNGLELREKIYKDTVLRKKSIPFVFLSTAARAVDVVAAYDFSVQGFFTKESTLEGMEDVLKRIIDYWQKCNHPNAARKQL